MPVLGRAPRPGTTAGSVRGQGAPCGAAGSGHPSPACAPHPVPEAGSEQGREPSPMQWHFGDLPGDGDTLGPPPGPAACCMLPACCFEFLVEKTASDGDPRPQHPARTPSSGPQARCREGSGARGLPQRPGQADEGWPGPGRQHVQGPRCPPRSPRSVPVRLPRAGPRCQVAAFCPPPPRKAILLCRSSLGTFSPFTPGPGSGAEVTPDLLFTLGAANWFCLQWGRAFCL